MDGVWISKFNGSLAILVTLFDLSKPGCRVDITESMNLYIYFACLFVLMFVSNKRQNCWTERAQILCGTSRDPSPGKGYEW